MAYFGKLGPLFGDSSGFLVLGFCLNLVSLSLNLIGFATPFWVKITSSSSTTYIFGLWRLCWFWLIQGTASVGFGSLLLVSLLLCIYIFMMKRRNRIVLITSVCLTVIAAVFICIAIVTLGATKMEDMLNFGDIALSENVHFSYVFSVISMVTSSVAAISLVFDIKFN